MNIFYGLDSLEAPLANSVVTSGTFDGVHNGHQKIIDKLTKSAKAMNAESVIITFWPHPRIVLFPHQTDLKLLTTLDEKIELLKKYGVDNLLIIEFTKDFSNWTSDEFIKKVLIKNLNTRKLILGYDHKFGKNREGSFEYLKENSSHYGFELEEIPSLDIDSITISSSKIRKALQEGAVEVANEYLGFEYKLSGIVKRGDQIGRQIGYPTANIRIQHAHKLVPASGIYAVKVMVRGQLFLGMLSIGVRPTVSEDLEQTIEVHIFDFDRNIYNEIIDVFFVKKIRDEIKFPSLEELKLQLDKDKVASLDILNSIKKEVI